MQMVGLLLLTLKPQPAGNTTDVTCDTANEVKRWCGARPHRSEGWRSDPSCWNWPEPRRASSGYCSKCHWATSAAGRCPAQTHGNMTYACIHSFIHSSDAFIHSDFQMRNITRNLSYDSNIQTQCLTRTEHKLEQSCDADKRKVCQFDWVMWFTASVWPSHVTCCFTSKKQKPRPFRSKWKEGKKWFVYTV